MKPFFPGSGLLLAASMAAGAAPYSPLWNAIVSPHPAPGEYASINAAVAAAPAQGEPWRILVKAGVWQERLVIDKPLLLVGESRDRTIIEANTPAGAMDSSGTRKSGTFRTSTVEVRASDVGIERLTIRNSFDFPANQGLPDGDPRKLKDTQAVALMVSEGADRVRFRHLGLEGYQDTFYSKTGSRSYFTDCVISGHIDFIFGGGLAVFDHCDLIARRNPGDTPAGYITAPSTLSSSPYGLVVLNSRLIHEPGVAAKSVALGRPWHPTTSFPDGRYADPDAVGLAVFMESDIGDHIYGWDKMSGKDKQGNTLWFYPQDSRFYTFNNRGPGAPSTDGGKVLTAVQAEKYRVSAVLADWPRALLTR